LKRKTQGRRSLSKRGEKPVLFPTLSLWREKVPALRKRGALPRYLSGEEESVGLDAGKPRARLRDIPLNVGSLHSWGDLHALQVGTGEEKGGIEFG